MAETSRSARTVETWWPAILTALTEDVTNARTEGFNRIIKDTKRVGCGYRNRENYRRRILAHSALIRRHRSAADRPSPRRCEEPLYRSCSALGQACLRLAPGLLRRYGRHVTWDDAPSLVLTAQTRTVIIS